MHGLGLDFVEFQDNHTGQKIAEKVKDIIHDFWLDGKVIGIVVDNAKANDVAIQSIANVLKLDDNTFPNQTELHFRCFGHILNLGCKGEVFLHLKDY